MVDLGVLPSFSIQVIDENVVELKNEVPASENEELVFSGEKRRHMATSWLWRSSLWLSFFPLEAL